MLHQSAQLPKLIPRRETHLLNVMFKNRDNIDLLNRQEIYTRLHDAPAFVTFKPNSEKYKTNVYYKGAVAWNNLPSNIRNIETYEKFKNSQKMRALNQL